MLTSVEAELGIMSTTISDESVAQEVADSLPPAQTTDITPPAPVVPPVGGLTGPSQGLLVIAGLIILIAFYSFFVRGGRDD